MKNILLFFGLFIITNNIFAQSLADRTGEQRSLYNAACIINGITPGDIGMKEGRKLMAEYAESIGLNYELYLHNGGNNLYILHYNPGTVTDTVETTNDVEETTFDMNFEDNIRRGEQETASSDNVDPNNDSSSYLVEAGSNNTVNTIDTITLTVVDTMVITNTVMNTVVDTIEEKYCDCTGMTLEMAWEKHELLKNSYKADKLENNQFINAACRVKLRKYIYDLQRVQRDLARNTRHVEEMSGDQKTLALKDNRWYVPMIGDIEIKKLNVQPKAIKTSNTKKRRTRRLGKGHASGKNNSIWSKIFPFRGCK